eukprot:scaffold1906_cov34-Tisochrysis_lutea.AAC.5
MGNTVLGPANTAKYICIWPPAKYISNTFEAYNPGRASNTAKAKYTCIWPLAKYGKYVFRISHLGSCVVQRAGAGGSGSSKFHAPCVSACSTCKLQGLTPVFRPHRLFLLACSLGTSCVRLVQAWCFAPLYFWWSV